MVKRGRGIKVIIFLGFLILLVIPLASAGFFSDFKAKITGQPTQDTTALSITIGNTAPTITNVEAIQAQNVTESGATSVTFNFTATDTDGGNTINVSSAQGRFQLSGEATRQNISCVNWSLSGNDVNFTCTIGMYYFDKAATNWQINVTIKDNNDARGINESTNFQYNLFTAMVMSPTSLNWTEFGVTATNQESSSNPLVLNNTGNDIDLTINVTAFNLEGPSGPQYIFAANLTVNNVAADCAGGTQMSNATSLNVTSTILQRGNNSLNDQNATSGQEQTYFCVTAVNSDLSAQSYSSAAYGAWTIQIIT